MTLPPELQILTINATILAVAYAGIYPTLRPVTLSKVTGIDLVLTVLSVGVAGALFWGRGVGFSLLVLEVNWAVFAILTMMAMEFPLARWFLRKHGLWPGGGER